MIFGALKINTMLSNLYLNCCDNWSSAIYLLKFFFIANLSTANSIGNEGCRIICDVLKTNTVLAKLGLNCDEDKSVDCVLSVLKLIYSKFDWRSGM